MRTTRDKQIIGTTDNKAMRVAISSIYENHTNNIKQPVEKEWRSMAPPVFVRVLFLEEQAHKATTQLNKKKFMKERLIWRAYNAALAICSPLTLDPFECHSYFQSLFGGLMAKIFCGSRTHHLRIFDNYGHLLTLPKRKSTLNWQEQIKRMPDMRASYLSFH